MQKVVRERKAVTKGYIFDQLTSLTEEEYKKLLNEFDKAVKKKIKCYTLKGAFQQYVREKESLNSSEIS